MKSFTEFVTEKTGTFEIATLKAKEYKSSIEKAGLKVKTADEDGLVVVGDANKLKSWLKKNEWDPEEIKSILN